MSVRVRIEHGQDAGKTFRVAKPGVYVVGRHAAAAIRLLDMKVSKAHCHLKAATGNGTPVVLTDLGSTHGTLLNGNPVKGDAPLNPGDEVRLGMTILRILSDGPADVEAEPLAPGSTELPGSEDMAATIGVRREGSAPGRGGTGAKAAPPPKKKVFPPDELVGQDLAGYKVLEKIGQGGMGAVYIAEQKSLHRKVALKVLSQRLVSDAAFVDQFVNEARAAGQLNHPNVVQVYDVGQENGRYFFSMEFVAGGSLEDRIKEKGKATWQEALPWFLDSASAFIFAQRRGILHRDVKPDNLMVAEDGSAKLCDLGLAKKSESQDLLSQGIIGTPHFISPEAIRRKKEIDGRSDLYSLGCAFYRLLTGENPYGAGKSVKDILMAHLREPVPRVSAKVADVPKDMDEVIYRLMQKEPDQRFANAEDLHKALDKIRIQHGLEAHGLKQGSRKPLVIAILAVLAAAAVAGYFVTKPPPEPPPKSQADIDREEAERKARELARLGDKFKIYVSEREADFLKLQLQVRDKNLRATWKDPSWEKVTEEFRTYANGLREDETYGAQEEVIALAKKAEDEAEKIQKHREMRRGLERQVAAAQKTALQDLEQALGAHKEAYGKALVEKRWLDAAALLEPAALEKVLQPIADRKIGPILPPNFPADQRAELENEPLLSAEAIADVVKRLLGDPPMQAWFGELEQKARGWHADRKKALDEIAAPATEDALRKAAEQAEADLGELPPEDTAAKEGTVAWLLQEFRDKLTKWKAGWEKAAEETRGKAFAADRAVYFELLKGLREPQRGRFWKFRFSEAAERAETARQKMQTPAYQNATAELAEDAKALAGLMVHLRESFEKGAWANDKILIAVGDTAKPSKVKTVTPEGLACPDLVTFAEMDPREVLAQVFYTDGDTPRFAFSLEDHRALAVLAETVGRFDLAQRHYVEYRKGLAPENTRTQEEMMRRFATLGPEQAAADAWAEALRLAMQVQAFLDQHDPTFITEEAFADKALREELIQGKGDLLKKLQDAQGLRARLQDDSRLAATVWGSTLRTAPHREMRFVQGEPDPPAETPPK